MFLNNFNVVLPEYQSSQEETIAWLMKAYDLVDAKFSKLVRRYVCKPSKLRSRRHALVDFKHADWKKMTIFNLEESASGKNMHDRMLFFSDVAKETFRGLYADELEPPEEIIHVTCTGYVSPSAAQIIVSEKNWGETTEVDHVYHMGCYASIPAIKLAQRVKRRIDIVHTELCSLHFDPSIRTPEQLVVQGLFADGMIKYSALSTAISGLEVLNIRQEIIPTTANDMTWNVSSHSMRMTLARNISKSITSHLPGYFKRLCGPESEEIQRRAIFAIHPGGPQIIDEIAKTLSLSKDQLEFSEKILLERGNMSSATIPHIWKEINESDRIENGRLIVSIAFGPGLTMAGALLRKKS